MIVRKLEALFTINTNAEQFKRATEQLDKLSNKTEKVMKTIAGYWAVQALQNFVMNTASAMAEIGKSAEYIGIGADALQELRYAAEKSGVSVDALNDAIKEIQIRATDAQSGKGETAEAFKMLGLRSTDAAGRIREPLELLDAVADRLKTLPTHSERLWVADAIFGDEGSTVIKMLKEGSLGLHKLRQEARSMGVVLDYEATAKAARFGASLKGLKTTSQITANAFVQGLMRPLSWLMEKASAIANAFNQLASRASVVRVALLSLSGVVTALAIKGGIMLAAFLAPFAPLMLAIAGVVAGIIAASIVIEDLWVAIKGGDSLIASVLGSMSDTFSIVRGEVTQFTHWLNEKLAQLVQGANEFFANLVPGFIKKGFLATVKHVASIPEAPSFNARLAPTPSSILNNQRLSHTQNVSVAVNVKSGANPQEIGGEITKALRKELERERFNAFMGVTQYAG